MKKRLSSRELAVRKASELFQRQGYHGTGLTQIIDESGSPKGSFYHHFPDGKEQLAVEAIESMASLFSRLVIQAADSCDGEALYIKRISGAVEQRLIDTDFLEGCPVAGFATEGAQYDLIRSACSNSYELWRKQMSKVLSGFGYSPRAALDRANLIIASLDGAILMCRVTRDRSPIKSITRGLTTSAK